MIVGEQKPPREVFDLISIYGGGNVLILGCDSCVSVSLAGGKEEVKEMISALQRICESEGMGWTFTGATVRRQCEKRFHGEVADLIAESDVVVSMGCGVGAQVLAENNRMKNVVPAVNTSNMGAQVKHGVFKEKCVGCGDCTIHLTAGICTLARCAKSLQNGPCGGSIDGKCEVDPDTECAWYQIYEALRQKGQTELMTRVMPPKDWSKSHSRGARTVKKEGNR
ncbi:MAG: methylenetetrahydrofolate reductase C-terminal domain-containing protein [Candidatus Methanomethylophilaceae archaeon]|jgi:ferredoxin|nr:methylenetetrahydrofolate reductase C-terminal domain-containing protein [Candidatus Methanomethylophilaceae archaeon]NLF33606.1 hypothetical protein [Thermoplasmatales archaeon]